MLESDWLTSTLTFKELYSKVVPSRQVLSTFPCPYHFTKWFQLFQSQPKTAKEPNPTTTLTKQINSLNNGLKVTNDFINLICHKIMFYYCSLRKWYIFPEISPWQTHTHTVQTGVVCATLMILSVRQLKSCMIFLNSNVKEQHCS